jgi:hypothetical protein
MVGRHAGTRVAPWVLLLASMLVLFGHVCALPLADAGGASAHGGLPGDEHGAIHAASCDAVLAQSAGCPALPALTAPTKAAAPLAVIPAPLPDRPIAPVSSPPLFLLHAALLI